MHAGASGVFPASLCRLCRRRCCALRPPAPTPAAARHAGLWPYAARTRCSHAPCRTALSQYHPFHARWCSTDAAAHAWSASRRAATAAVHAECIRCTRACGYATTDAGREPKEGRFISIRPNTYINNRMCSCAVHEVRTLPMLSVLGYDAAVTGKHTLFSGTSWYAATTRQATCVRAVCHMLHMCLCSAGEAIRGAVQDTQSGRAACIHACTAGRNGSYACQGSSQPCMPLAP